MRDLVLTYLTAREVKILKKIWSMPTLEAFTDWVNSISSTDRFIAYKLVDILKLETECEELEEELENIEWDEAHEVLARIMSA